MNANRLLLCVVLGVGATTPLLAGQEAAPAVREPWPSPAEMALRRAEAEQLSLFATTDPVRITLTADFKAIQSDRNPESRKTFPATIQFTAEDGTQRIVDLQVRTRGHSRRSYDICDFAPLRLEFPKGQMKDSVFEGQKAIKLGVHCREGVKEFEQYVLREYAAYRIYNLLTPQSFRARLAHVTYVDAVKGEPISTRFGMFLEDDDDVAKRMGGRITEQRQDLARLDKDVFTRMTLFEYMIGNLDVSIITFHNIKAVQVPDGTVYPVPYDFDYSGLVNTTYAQPPRGLHITTVRDRLFRGPCRTEEELRPFLDSFRGIRSRLAPLYASLPEFMDDGAQEKALKYLDGFYKVLAKPDAIKKAFMRNCLAHGLM